ncbi:MAG: hypothetical protein HOP33_11385 [Verrucomicrobia bacterium]|nr:hypothetical protein [Verrucomicrobiota bacterium]
MRHKLARQETAIKPLNKGVLARSEQMAETMSLSLWQVFLKGILKRGLIHILLWSLVVSANAANWYVRSSSVGSNNGTDWNNAWSLSSINWASVSAGDTIYLAGGSYGVIAPGKSGTAGNVITLRRARSTNAACTGASGWSSGFDATINASGINIGALDYLIIDGVIASGIKVLNNDRAVSITSGSVGVTLSYIEIYATAANGSSSQAIYMTGCSFTTIDHCIIHGVVNGIQGLNFSDCIIQYCEFYDINAHGTTGHPNVNYLLATVRSTWRYNRIHNNDALGIAWEDGAGDDLNYLYGNVFYDDTGAHCGIESDSNIPRLGRFYIYNNAFINEPATTINFRVTPAGGQIFNNIFWNSPQLLANWSTMELNYNFASGSAPAGANSIGSGSNPFVNLAGKDFHIVSNIGAKFPRNKGVTVTLLNGSTSTVDVDGIARGADGLWDIGPYEFVSNGPNTNPVIAISPTSLDFGAVSNGSTITKSITIQNIGGGTLAGAASVALPFTIVSGGSYSLGSNQSSVVTIGYSPASSSDSQVVTFTGGGGATVTLNGYRLAFLPGNTFESYAGNITAPFVTNSGGYISQPSETTVTTGGQAVYGFTITSPGSYVISANINAPGDAANSLYLNIDSQPSDPNMIWDIPITTGFQPRVASWRGAGTFDSPQFVPAVFNLTAGVHQLILRGREGGVQIGRISVAPYSTVTPPQNLHVVSGF